MINPETRILIVAGPSAVFYDRDGGADLNGRLLNALLKNVLIHAKSAFRDGDHRAGFLITIMSRHPWQRKRYLTIDD
jgi:hypothetical protein